MGKMIPLIEYARIHKKEPTHMTRKARMGMFKTTVKLGRDWLIDEDEPYVDYRFKVNKRSGKNGEKGP